jgi:acyl-CoA synthetase (AMP-forming)/AMP-acid ligase II
MNFALFLEMKARGAPDSPALSDRRCRLSWRELDELANSFANLLRHRSLRPGDRVAIYLPNRVEVVIALFAAMKAGVIAVPLNWRLQGPDLARVLLHCAPALVLTTAERSGAVSRLGAPPVLTVDDAPASGSFWSELQALDRTFASVGRQSGDIAHLLYTSGTTATPKAAIHTHGMRVAIAAAMADCFKLSSRDVGLAISPLFHTAGISVMSNAIFAGCPLVMLEKWNLEEFLDAIERERVTFMHLISTIIVDIARAPDHDFRRDTSAMRFTWGGGHNVDPTSLKTFERRVGGVLLQGYSRTEGGLTYNPLDRARRRFDAHGLPNRNSSEVAIIDPATERIRPPGETGEIAVRGDGVSPGYWDREFLRVRTPYDGGWQPTGDLGYIEEDGTLHFLGRSDSMIKTGGENVYPAEVEAVLLAMPEVADAVVLGIPDERLGQRVAAVVVPTHPKVTGADIDRACRRALGGYKIPRTVAFIEALPRLGTQKVDLSACRELLARMAKSHL